MSDAPVRTMIGTADGELAFQHYFVRDRCAPAVTGFRFDGAAGAALSPEIMRRLDDPRLAGIIICPSNPFVSVDPVLAIPGMRERLARATVPVVAVSPIVAGAAIKGPTAKMMRELRIPNTYRCRRTALPRPVARLRARPSGRRARARGRRTRSLYCRDPDRHANVGRSRATRCRRVAIHQTDQVRGTRRVGGGAAEERSPGETTPRVAADAERAQRVDARDGRRRAGRIDADTGPRRHPARLSSARSG